MLMQQRKHIYIHQLKWTKYNKQNMQELLKKQVSFPIYLAPWSVVTQPFTPSFIEASVHQIRSVLTEVVQVLESTKVQEIELAEQVKTILTYNFPPGASEEEEPKALPSIPPWQLPPPLPPRPPDLSSIPPPIPQKKTKTLSSRHSPRSRTVKVCILFFSD